MKSEHHYFGPPVKTVLNPGPGGGGVLPYIGYIGTCRGIGYGFSVSWFLNRVSFFYPFVTVFQCVPQMG